jgi:hypothetical protein
VSDPEITLPKRPDGSASGLLVRTDFEDPVAWRRLLAALAPPVEDDRPYADLVVADDPIHAGLDGDQLIARLPEGFVDDYLLVADARALAFEEFPILVVPVPVQWVDDSEMYPDDVEDLREYYADRRAFRVIAEQLWGVQNNFAIANMDWEGFAGAVDPDGVFRDFRPHPPVAYHDDDIDRAARRAVTELAHWAHRPAPPTWGPADHSVTASITVPTRPGKLSGVIRRPVSWFGHGGFLEPEAGGRFAIEVAAERLIEGLEIRGTVTRIEERRITLAWSWTPGPSGSRLLPENPTSVTIQVEPAPPDSATVRIDHARLPPELVEPTTRLWAYYLRQLHAFGTGAQLSPFPWSRAST